MPCTVPNWRASGFLNLLDPSDSYLESEIGAATGARVDHVVLIGPESAASLRMTMLRAHAREANFFAASTTITRVSRQSSRLRPRMAVQALLAGSSMGVLEYLSCRVIASRMARMPLATTSWSCFSGTLMPMSSR